MGVVLSYEKKHYAEMGEKKDKNYWLIKVFILYPHVEVFKIQLQSDFG